MCKQFREIYSGHPGIVQALYLNCDTTVGTLPSLLAWLQQNKSSVQTFRAESGGPLAEAVLEALVSLRSSLKSVGIGVISACSLSSLAVFTRLETCALWRPDPDVLDLAPLGSLPSLNHLVLQVGHFKDLHHLSGLTRLACKHAIVSGVQRLAPTLQHLQIEHGIFDGIDTQGLSACPDLTQLVLINAVVVGNNDVMYLNSAMSLVPANIELLTQLHTLHISALPRNYSRAVANLAWVSLLTSLEDLSIRFEHAPDDMLRNAFLLTKLTRLVLTGNSQLPDDASDLGIEWHRLQALQTLSIHALHLGPSVAGLLRLRHLRQVSFSAVTLRSDSDHACFAAIIYNLARLCPQVKVEVHSSDLLQYFQDVNLELAGAGSS